jgi:molybdate transport system substrate-binding protein
MKKEKKFMKKVTALVLALTLALSLAACGSRQNGQLTEKNVEIQVFAAASMTETLDTIIEHYKQVAPNVTVTATYESSGTLLKQIKAGAVCDVFISAGQKQMNELDGALKTDAEKNPDGLDLLVQSSRVNLLENKVALVVPEGNPKNIQSFDDAEAALEAGNCLMAMGNSDVPVGQYTSKILKYFGMDETALATAGVITYGSNVKEVTTQVSEGAVDFGVVYATDAFSAKLTVADTATADMCGQVIYPAAVLNTSAQAESAQAFLDYLRTQESGAVFESVGFTVVK